MNLTRFGLFFPEKRTFFLRDADLFRFARIGGRLGFGISGESLLSQPDLENSLVGADFQYTNTRLPGNRVLQGEAWYQESDTEGVDSEQAAYGFRLRSPNVVGWRGGFGVKQIEENFFPALGFVNRAGIRDHIFEAGYARRLGGDFLQTMYTGIDAERIDLIDGDLQSQVISLRALSVESIVGDTAHLRLHSSKEALTEPFVIWDKSGERENIVAGIGWRPSNHFVFTTSYEANDVQLPTGNFISRLARLRAEVVFSATFSWSTLIQYDNVTETVGMNTRFHWIPEAGREAFIVLNHNLQDLDLDNRFKSTLADLAVKLNYTFRF